MATYCCAHRGAPSTHPENTLPSFLEAVRLGADMIEFDVRVTADGELVVIHDATVDRTTDGTGAIAELTLAEIKKFDAGLWRAEEFAGTRVPRFCEVLEVFPGDVLLNIELKSGEHLVELVIEELTRRDMLGQSLLGARNDQAETARGIWPEARVINFSRQNSAEEYVENTIATGAQFIQFGRSWVTRELVDRCHDNGVTVNVFKSDTPDDQRLLMDLGVDYILTDCPGVLLSTLGRAVE